MVVVNYEHTYFIYCHMFDVKYSVMSLYICDCTSRLLSLGSWFSLILNRLLASHLNLALVQLCKATSAYLLSSLTCISLAA